MSGFGSCLKYLHLACGHRVLIRLNQIVCRNVENFGKTNWSTLDTHLWITRLFLFIQLILAGLAAVFSSGVLGAPRFNVLYSFVPSYYGRFGRYGDDLPFVGETIDGINALWESINCPMINYFICEIIFNYCDLFINKWIIVHIIKLFLYTTLNNTSLSFLLMLWSKI